MAGKRGMTGLHGNQRRGWKVAHVKIVCEVCKSVRWYTPGEMRVRKRIRFCSIDCRSKGRIKVGSKVKCKCSMCGKETWKRADHLKTRKHAYCSRQCCSKARMIPNAKWRDKVKIKEYMKSYGLKNKQKINMLSRDWVRKNKSKRLACQRKYREVHKDKIKALHENRRAAKAMSPGKVTAREWVDIKKRHDFRCAMCGLQEPLIHLTMDHILALSNGGHHVPSNIQPLCKSCNSSKGKKIMEANGFKIVEV